MPTLTDNTSYASAQRNFSNALLWELFDGNRSRFNIAHECVDRHAVSGRVALRVAQADGGEQVITFAELRAWSSRVAHWLVARGIEPGDRVGIMLEPSLAFYAALFGAMKAGAVAVPLFTLFGAEGVRLRTADCRPSLLLTTPDKVSELADLDGTAVTAADTTWLSKMAELPDLFEIRTSAADLAIFQYTSGTTRALPAAIRHTHRALVVLMNAALYGTGLRPNDRFCCPSSPAWGHGLWHGTLAPLALGIETGAYAGKFSAERLLLALEHWKTTNLSAAATHYRMMRTSPAMDQAQLTLRKASFTGEPIDGETQAFMQDRLGIDLCSMYGTTEVGVILANYPAAEDFPVKAGSLGRPVPGVQVEVQRPDGARCAAGEVGEIKVLRHGEWFATKDRGWTDADGYFFHAGRADDVIISAGWTMSAIEIEDVLLRHESVADTAVIGVPDGLRGLVVKAFVVLRPGRVAAPTLVTDIQDFVRTHLSQHEYPRIVEFAADLPRTPAGKINRKALRDQETSRQMEQP